MNKKRSLVVMTVLVFLTTTLLFHPVQAATQLDSKNVYTSNSYWDTSGWYANFAGFSGTISSWYVSPGNYEVHYVGSITFFMMGGSLIIGIDGATITSVSTSNFDGVYISQGNGVGYKSVYFIGVMAQELVSIVWHITTTASSVTVFASAAAAGSSMPSWGYFTLALYRPSGGGGCPYLYVYNGSQYVNEGLLNIHANSDVTQTHVLTDTPAVVNGTYLLHTTEHWETISHINQVQLFATLSNGRTIQLPLVSAVETQVGNVLPQLLFDDNSRAVELGAKWNNGTSQSIYLRFKALPSFMHVVSFTFVIVGYNAIPK